MILNDSYMTEAHSTTSIKGLSKSEEFIKKLNLGEAFLSSNVQLYVHLSPLSPTISHLAEMLSFSITWHYSMDS